MVQRVEPDPRVRAYVMPTRIVWKSGDGESLQNADQLLVPGSGQVTMWGGNYCILKHTGEAPGLLLDFGRELHGGVQIAVRHTGEGNKPVRARVRFGESVSEAMDEPNQDHAVHDHICHLPWCGTHEVGNTGFRFVRIDLVDPGAQVELQQVRAVFLYRDLDYIGAFRSNDERLNTIFDTGAYGVHLNMQTGVWDGIKRDRLVWIGDMHPETTVISKVFGDQEVVRWSLDLTRDETPLPNWMNGISSYSLWWVIIHRDWYLHHGNLPYLMQQREYLTALLARLAALVDEQGVERMDGMRFLDWPTSEDPNAVHCGLQALLKWGLEAGAELCEVLGETATAALASASARRLEQHIPDPGQVKSPAALMALSGLVDAAEINARVLSQDQFSGISTFYGYYVLEARAKAGDYQGALDVIRKFWGAMLDLGATTFWEDFDLSWVENSAGIDELVPEGMRDIHKDFGSYCYKSLRHSLCHGWASGPTAWLSEHILGFKPLSPGCKQLAIQPHLADLEWAEGSFPTPYGAVWVKHVKQADGSILTDVEAPTSVEIVQ